VSLLRKVEDLDFRSAKLRDDLGYKEIYPILRLPGVRTESKQKNAK
jgi:hypothetical protein